MPEIIIGSVGSVGAMPADPVSGTRKIQKDILPVQCISRIFYIFSAPILMGYSAIHKENKSSGENH